MLAKRAYLGPALLLLAFPAAAPAAADGDGAPVRVGIEKGRSVDATPLSRPVATFHRAIRVGVRRVRAARRARLRRRRREAFAALPGGISLATLEAIAACESGGNPTALSADGSYRGKYQFSYGAWASVGGSGDPAAAPEAEQDYRAALLYARSGSAPWPICG